MAGGVVAGDFTQIANDMSASLTYYVSTKTTDPQTGAETETYAASTTKSLVFFTEENRYIFDKEGLLEVGDAYCLAATSVGIKRYDKVVGPDGKTYIIENVIRRYVTGVAMMDYAILYAVNS